MRLGLHTFLVRCLGGISKGFSFKDNFIVCLGLHFEQCASLTIVEISRELAERTLWWRVKLCHASLGTVFWIIKALDDNAVLSVGLGLSICYSLLVSCLACNFNYSTCQHQRQNNQPHIYINNWKLLLNSMKWVITNLMINLTREVFLGVRLLRICPVVASTAVNLPDDLHDQ